MKNLINCDYEKLQDQTASRGTMIRRDNKKLPYERIIMVQEIGKYSSKQSNKRLEISRAKRVRNKQKAKELADLIAEEQQVLEEEFVVAD